MATEEHELNILGLLRDSFIASGAIASTEDELRQQTVALLRFRHAINLIADAVAIADLAESKLVDFNETTPRLLGYSPEELCYLPLEMVFGERFFREIKSLQQSELTGRTFESTIKKRDRIEIPVEISLHICGFGGRKYAAAIIRNISARVEAMAEKAIIDEQMHRAAKMDAVANLAGGMAHDFNNQLTVIRGYCDLLLGQIKNNSDARQLTEQVIQAAERASALTGKLLSVGRSQILHPTVFNINSVLSAMKKTLIEMIGTSAELTMTLEPNVGEVNTDQSLFENTVMCLATNASEAIQEGGKISIRTANVDLGVDYVNKNVESMPGPHVMISVTDNGAGMDEQTLEKLFDPFFSTKPKGQGMGLGLTLVHGFVRQADGHIRVQSKVGEGTIFEIYLPRATPSEIVETQSQNTLRRSNQETILVVDDDAPVRKLLTTVLKDYGYNILEAGAADQAVAMVQKQAAEISMLITDVEMPGMSGPELAKMLAKINPQIKVLYISGHPIETVVRHGGGHAEMNQLQKPFRPTTLAQTVRTILDAPASPG